MTYDPGVIIRAYRFRAALVGYKLVRGATMDPERDSAMAWYAVPLDVSYEAERDARANGGYPTAAEACRAAEMRAERQRGEG